MKFRQVQSAPAPESKNPWLTAFAQGYGRELATHRLGADVFKATSASSDISLLGLACVQTWKFIGLEHIECCEKLFMKQVLAQNSQTEILGFIDYPILATARLPVPLTLKRPLTSTDLRHILQHSDFEVEHLVSRDVVSWCDLAASWSRQWAINPMNSPTPVQVAPVLAHAAMRGLWPSLSLAAVNQRTHRGTFLSPGWPSASALAHFVHHRQQASASTDTMPWTQHDRLPRLQKKRVNTCCTFEYDPMHILRFLESSRFLKDIRDLRLASKSFLRSLFPDQCDSLFETAARVPGRPAIHRARVRLHCVALLLERRKWSHAVAVGLAPRVWRYLSADASPQVGLELFGTTFDTVTDGNFIDLARKFTTITSLGYGHCGLVDKLMALLWQIWLMAGPKTSTMREWLDTVRGVTTDLGVEKELADAPDVLPCFMHWLRTGSVVPHLVQRGTYLFPNAIFCPGWAHLISGILENTTASIDWFPGFLVKLRAVNKLFRSKALCIAIARAVPHWTASELEELSKSTRRIAKWRWNTLFDVCERILERSFVLRHWPAVSAALLQNTKDKASTGLATEAMESPEFWRRTAAIYDLARPFEKLRRWGLACPCHEPLLLRGETVECKVKGRRLLEASEKIRRFVQELMTSCDNLCVSDFEGDHDLLLTVSNARRLGAALTQEKFKWVDALPYTLCRVNEQACAVRCLQEFDAKLETDHHRVSIKFLGSSSLLRSHIEDVAQGRDCSPELRREVEALSGLMLSEDKTEGIHRVVHRERDRAVAALVPWISSTHCLLQNMRLVSETLGLCRGLDVFTAEWVVRLPGSHAYSSALLRAYPQPPVAIEHGKISRMPLCVSL